MAGVAEYQALITSEHADKPKFAATVGLLVSAFSDEQNVVSPLADVLTDLDTAVGAQLDILGKWIGLSRQVRIPITGVFFSWDTAGLGWDQGQILGPYDDGNQVVRLDDATYRQLLRAQIGANTWDGTITEFQAIMDQVFAGTGTRVTMEDLQDMSINILVTGATPPALLLALIVRGYLAVKPVTVRINGYFVSSTSGPIFAWDVPPGSSPYFSGWDVGSWAIPL